MFVTFLERLGQLVLAFISWIFLVPMKSELFNLGMLQDNRKVIKLRQGFDVASFTLPRDGLRLEPLRAAIVSSPTCADNHRPRTTHTYEDLMVMKLTL